MARQAATGASPTRVGDDRTLPELTLPGLVLGALITVVLPAPTSISASRSG